MMMGRGWHRVRGTAPNVQTFECTPYDAKVIQADDAGIAGDQQLRHAKQQLALASQYPGRERSMPRAKIIEFDTAKR
jgi:hypothetical protein